LGWLQRDRSTQNKTTQTNTKQFWALSAAIANNAAMNTPHDDQWLTPPEVARQLRVKPERVIAWIKAGQLAASNLGDGSSRPRFRVSPQSLADFLDRRRPNAPAAPRRRRRTLAAGVKTYY